MGANISLFCVILFFMALFACIDVLALNVNPSSVTILVGSATNIAVTNISGSVRVSSNDPSVATVAYSTGVATITGIKSGSTTIRVRDRRSSQNISVNIIKANQTISFGALPSIAINGTGNVSAIATSNLAVTFTSSTATTCSVSGSTVTGKALGNCVIVANQAGNATYNVATSVTRTITVTTPLSMTVSPTSVIVSVGATTSMAVSNTVGAVTLTSSNTSRATATVAGNIITVRGVSAGSATLTIRDAKPTIITVPVTVQAATPSPIAGNYRVIAWNDLGMHCMDGMDFSISSILPVYNTLHAQVKDKSGKIISTGITLTYEAVRNTSGYLNTSSADKINFWDNVGLLFGFHPDPDVGVNLDGLTSGAPAPGNKTPSLTPRAMTYNADYKWWEAEGIPISPFPDPLNGATGTAKDANGNVIRDFYPTVKIVAKDLKGIVLGETKTVLPVSDEMTCKGCHASSTVSTAAKPVKGWVNNSDLDKDWKLNILRLHDQNELSTTLYLNALATKGYNSKGLEATAVESQKPVLCAGCHLSNAYFDKLNKTTVMPGLAGIKPFTQALHLKHASVIDPITKLPLDTSGDRQACYNCHPGSVTQCLRGAMSTLKDATTGDAAISCQSCHGNLAAVGNPARQGWFNEPTCESCHNSAAPGKRAISGVNASGISNVPTDHTFATNPNTPVAGLNLYRFSTGHGGLQCEACHGATHAEYPSTNADDNAQSITAQGHAGTIAECSACHATTPTTFNGGPHGMHTSGNAWVSSHQGAKKNGTATTPSCAYCHGTSNAGSPLSAIKVAKTINAGEFGTKNWPAGYQVSCFSCHNGPNP